MTSSVAEVTRLAGVAVVPVAEDGAAQFLAASGHQVIVVVAVGSHLFIDVHDGVVESPEEAALELRHPVAQNLPDRPLRVVLQVRYAGDHCATPI